MKIEQSQVELRNSLLKQFNFIKKSSKEYDGSNISEAKRLTIHK